MSDARKRLDRDLARLNDELLAAHEERVAGKARAASPSTVQRAWDTYREAEKDAHRRGADYSTDPSWQAAHATWLRARGTPSASNPTFRTGPDLRERVAKSDMALARREGELTIGQTLKGAVDLRYDRATGRYSLTQARPDFSSPTPRAHVTVLAEGTARAVLPVLAALYDVRSEG